MIRSLRLRLLVGSSLAIIGTLALLGAAVFALIRNVLISDFDSASLVKAQAVAAMAEQNGLKVKFELDPQATEFNRGRRPEYFQMWLDDGTVVARSPSLDGNLPAITPTGECACEDVPLPDGRRGRLLTLRFTPKVEPDEDDPRPVVAPVTHTAVLAFARETATRYETLSRLRRLLVVLFLLALVLSGLVLSLVVTRAMRPVKRLAREIESFREADLSQRLSPHGVPSELSAVVQRLNGLIGRLEAAFQREHSFTADVAHELRTPISGLHTTLQVCRSRPRDREAYESAIDKCLKMTAGIGSIVDTLLLLARADAGQLCVGRTPVDLAGLIDDCWEPYRRRAEGRRLRVEPRLARPCRVETDAEKLKIVLNNLFDNAVSYADEGGLIRISCERERDATTLAICNSAQGVTPEDAARVFERFWRGDESRSAIGFHCGLGLSLCQRLVELLGGQISAKASDGMFAIVVSGIETAGKSGNGVLKEQQPVEGVFFPKAPSHAEQVTQPARH